MKKTTSLFYLLGLICGKGYILENSISKDREIENTYIVMEQYIDQDSVDAHGKSDHFRTASEKLAECLDGAPVIKRLDSIY